MSTDITTAIEEFCCEESRGGGIPAASLVKNLGGTSEILLYGAIGFDPDMDYITSKQFVEAMKAIPINKTLVLRINSPGGFVWEGLAMVSALRRHQGRKIAEIDGCAYSAASFIPMACDEIYMADDASMMIHNAEAGGHGDGEYFIKRGNQLNDFTRQIAGIYAKKTGMPIEKILGMMAAETWMTTQEAQELRFVDKVLPALGIAAKVDWSKYKNAPANVVQSMKSKAVYLPPASPVTSKLPLELRAALERDKIRFGKQQELN